MADKDSDEDALVDNVYGCSGMRKRQIRKGAERLSVKEGNLHYYFKKGGKLVKTHTLATKLSYIVLFGIGSYWRYNVYTCTEPN